MRLVHLNSDRGIHPTRSKGAAVHLRAMRQAFGHLGVEVIAIDEPELAQATSALEAAREAGELDMIYERLALDGCAGAEFARRHGLPHVLEVNAPLDEEQSRYRSAAGPRGDAQRMGEMLSAARLVLCVSKDCAEWARSRGAAPERVVVAGNGVDAERFHPRLRGELEQAQHIAPQDFVIGFHGRLRPWHGFERLVTATSSLHQHGVPVHLLMVGKGEFEAAIGELLPRSCWTHISWVDHDEVGRYVARFDVLPLSYDPELPCYFSPLKLLEGMAAGAVALVPDLGDLSETVEHGRGGRIYDAHEPSALAEALAHLHSDPIERAALASEGRRIALGRSWNSIARLVLERIAEHAR